MGIQSSREYMGNITFNKTQLQNMMKAQRITYDSGLVSLSSNRMITALSPLSTVLGLLFVTSTPAGIAAGVAGIYTGLLSNTRETLKSLVMTGYWEMDYYEDLFNKYPQYTSIEAKVRFIEYVVDGKTIRWITGKGYPLRIKTSNGWITM